MKSIQHAISTKTPQVWTHETRVYLYNQLLEKVGGAWSRYDWMITAQRPKDCIKTNLEFNAIFQEIYDEMKDKNFSMFTDTGSSRNPKSVEALKQQFQWSVSTQPTIVNKGGLNNQRRNRMAAYEAGFLTMSDIIFLENVAEMRLYIG